MLFFNRHIATSNGSIGQSHACGHFTPGTQAVSSYAKVCCDCGRGNVIN